MCMTDKFFGELARAIGRTDLIADPRFNAQSVRQANRTALTEIIDGELRKETNQHWLGKLGGVLPVAPVLDLAQALDNPFLRATDMIRDLPHPAKPGMRTLANPIRVDGKRLDQSVCSPFGADNDTYLADTSSLKRVAVP
jgi:crotonobetainyl-CoA:carnitine CoA-transferase CaiB-like acyl-CoA transferase